MINQEYKERVRLLLRIIPIISTEECFAVHGGTAINLFVQNLPRYSVDIDLTYIPVEPREASLAHIKERLKAIKAKIEAAIPGIAIREVPNKLICTHNGHFVKVEVNDVKRGIMWASLSHNPSRLSNCPYATSPKKISAYSAEPASFRCHNSTVARSRRHSTASTRATCSM